MTYLPPIHINNVNINLAESVKNLGIILNKQLNWSNHIKANYGKTFAMFRNLWMTQYFTPIHIRMLLAKTYLLPTLIYGCELFASYDAVSRRRLNVTFNNIARYVCIWYKKRNSSISHYAKQIYNITFDNLMKCRVLLLLHKIIYNRQPHYLYQNFLLLNYIKNYMTITT